MAQCRNVGLIIHPPTFLLWALWCGTVVQVSALLCLTSEANRHCRSSADGGHRAPLTPSLVTSPRRYCKPLPPARSFKALSATASDIVVDWKADHLPDGRGDDADENNSPVEEMGPEAMLREWFPLSFESYLDPSVPNPVLHMGRNLAVWRDGDGEWSAVDDMCPHKLAPLSDGSIAEDGKSLRCSYHGWRFNGCGGCVAIPSLPRDAPIPPRCSVRSYPVRRTGKMLWIWMDPSVEPNYDSPRLRHAEGCWDLSDGYQREVAYSWDYLFENILDPTHVAYSHFGVGKEFNRTEVDEIRDEHVTNLRTRYTNEGVQLRFNRTINGRNKNETWDFLYPGVWFLRRSPALDRGGAGVIMASPIDSQNTRLMSTGYNPVVTKKEESAVGKLKAKLLSPVFKVLFHTTLNRFFNSDAFLIRYQQEMVASGETPHDPLKEYELASPADQGTVAFRRWHLKRLGGKLPMARPLVPESKRELGSVSRPVVPGPALITREEAADPWEQHSKNCPTCRGAHNISLRVKYWSAALAALVALLRPVIGTCKSFVGSLALSVLSFQAHRFALSFRKKGHVHGYMRGK